MVEIYEELQIAGFQINVLDNCTSFFLSQTRFISLKQAFIFSITVYRYLTCFWYYNAHVKYQILLHNLFPILKLSRINLGFNRHPNRHLNHHLHRHHHLPPTKGDKNIQSIYKEHIKWCILLLVFYISDATLYGHISILNIIHVPGTCNTCT